MLMSCWVERQMIIVPEFCGSFIKFWEINIVLLKHFDVISDIKYNLYKILIHSLSSVNLLLGNLFS